MDATRVSRTHIPVSDRRHHELLVKFSRIIVWSEREPALQEPCHGLIPDPAMWHYGRPEDADAAHTCHTRAATFHRHDTRTWRSRAMVLAQISYDRIAALWPGPVVHKSAPTRSSVPSGPEAWARSIAQRIRFSIATLR